MKGQNGDEAGQGTAGRGGATVLITGAGGYLGRKLVQALAGAGAVEPVIATDIHLPSASARLSGVVYERMDVGDPASVEEAFGRHAPDVVVHLASIVTPGRDSDRAAEYRVDVLGTRHVLQACLAHGVAKLIVTSSGAAYGYHADNSPWLEETHPLRGNEAFAYAHHKRLVEEMLAHARGSHPELAQLILRPGTILGEGVRNPITNLLDKPVVMGVAGSESPFVLVWDEDVVACLVLGIREPREGVFNVAGDGVLPLREMARRLGRRYVPLPAWLVSGALRILHPLGLTRYRPEQVDFLRYRPVLSNRRLKEEFGYAPRMTTEEVLDFYARSRARRVVLITGAAGGIGTALAHRYARAGAWLVLLDLDGEALGRLGSELAGRGATVLTLSTDVTDERACQVAVHEAVRRFGGLDVLVLAAGRTHLSHFAETEAPVLRAVMDVNFFGAVHVARAALPSLMERRGRVAVLSSVAGFAPLAGRSGYAASKHALHGLFESLRGELEEVGVGVTMVCPAFVRTDIGTRALGGDGRPATAIRTETGRPMEPEELAEAVFQGVERGRRLVIPSLVARTAYLLSRVAPALYERVMLRRLLP